MILRVLVLVFLFIASRSSFSQSCKSGEGVELGQIRKLEYRDASGSIKGHSPYSYQLAGSSGTYKAGDVVLYGGFFWKSAGGSVWPPALGSWSKTDAAKYENLNRKYSYRYAYSYVHDSTLCGTETSSRDHAYDTGYHIRYDEQTDSFISESCYGGGTSLYLLNSPTESVRSEGQFTVHADCSHDGEFRNYYNGEYVGSEVWVQCGDAAPYCWQYDGNLSEPTEKYNDGSYSKKGTDLDGSTFVDPSGVCAPVNKVVSESRSGDTVFELSGIKSGAQALNEVAASGGAWISTIDSTAYLGSWSSSGNAFTFSGRAVRFEVWFACLSDKTELDLTYSVWPMEGSESADGEERVETRAAGSLDLKKAEEGGFIVKGMIEAKDGYFKRLVKVEKHTSCGGVGDNNFGGSSGGSVGSLHWWVGLGMNSDKTTAGYLRIDVEAMSVETATPKPLRYDGGFNKNAVVLKDQYDRLRQVKAAQGLADIVILDDYSYEIRFYDLVDVDDIDASGFYKVSGVPLSVWKVENPAASATSFNELKIAHTLGGNEEYLFANNATGEWSLEKDGSQTEELVETTLTSGDKQIDRTQKNESGVASFKEREVYRQYPFGKRLISRVLDPSGAALTSTWDYYDNPTTDGAAFGQLKNVMNADGSWKRYEYDNEGRRNKVVSTWLNGSPSASESSSRVVTTTWSVDGLTATIVEKVEGQEIGRRYWVKNSAETEFQSIVCTVPGASIGASTNLISTNQYVASGEFKGRIALATNSNGTISTYSYSQDPGTGRYITIKASGEASGITVIAGKRTTTIEDEFGNLISHETKDIASGLVIESYEVTDADEFGRPLRIDYGDGSYETKTYACCGVESERGRDGVVTNYTYDGLKRVVSESRGGLTILYTYDGSGRVLTRSQKGTDNSIIVKETNTYDLAGRQTSSKDALNHTTEFIYAFDGSGRLVETTTFPDSGTRVETTNKDGQIASTTGTAVHPLKYEYGTTSLGMYQKEIRLGAGGAETEWTQTESDAAGRTLVVAEANGGETTYSYNSLGQLSKQVDPDGVAVLYTYNGEGDREKTVIDKDHSDSLSSADSVTIAESSVLTAHGATVQRQETRIINASNAEVVASRVDTTPNGLQQWTEQWGLQSSRETTIGSNGARTETTVRPDGSQIVRASVYDRVTSEVVTAGSTAISSTTYSYDAHGRPESSTDGRNGTTTYTYNSLDQLISTTNPGSQTRAFTYDSMGRQLTQTLPDSSQIVNEYYLSGELKKTSGSQTYTAEYTYDPQGRMKTLTTVGSAGPEVTTWNYDSASGLLVSKAYADSNGPSYTHTSGGRLLTRVWARGITTTYSYDNGGDLIGIDYSDSTPDVSYTRNRLGHITGIVDGAGSRTLTVTDDGRPLTETYGSGMFTGVASSIGYDSLKRRSNYDLQVGATSLAISCGYDGASRLTSVTSSSDEAVYHYISNSNLIDLVTQSSGGVTKLVTSKSYDNLNRLTQISASAGSNVISSYTYTYNGLNQRTLAEWQDGTKWEYSYDGMGQVTGGRHSWGDNTPVEGQQYEYSYDNIGNRATMTTNGRLASYNSNVLNQYVSRSVPGALDVIGEAANDAVVTVNSLLASRKGSYFYRELLFSNHATPQYPDVKVMAVKNGSGAGGDDLVSKREGHQYIVKTPEVFIYDVDGNLISDGRWQYIWDGENRLTGMESHSFVPTQLKRQMIFAYDAQSRRFRKDTYNWDGNNFQLVDRKSYVWDDLNMMAELSLSGDVEKAFVWANDLTSMLQKNGSSGELLIFRNASDSYYPAYEGNGNISHLIVAATQKIAARYFYGPYGEPIGVYEDNVHCPIRFGTKFHDAESGLVYFGARYYNTLYGRWLNRDPLPDAEMVEGPNLYAYVANDPIMNFDLWGMETINLSDEELIGELDKMRNMLRTKKVKLLSEVEWIELINALDTKWYGSKDFLCYSGDEFPELRDRVISASDLNYIGVGEGFSARGLRLEQGVHSVHLWKWLMYRDNPSRDALLSMRIGFYYYTD